MLSTPIYLRRFVRGCGPTEEFWNLYKYRDRFGTRGYAISSGTGSGPGAIERVTHDQPEKIQPEIDDSIARKLAEGYRDVSDQPYHGGYDSPLRRSMEDALAENPDDLASHMAYADHLTDLGDPRGEFIRVLLALEDATLATAERERLARREAELLALHQRTWLGPLACFWLDKIDDRDGNGPWRDPHHHTWRRGWIDSLWFYDGWGGVQAALACTPMLRCLRELRLVRGDPGPDDSYGYSDLSHGTFFRNVRVLQVGNHDSDQNYFSETAEASEFYDQMPRLEELHIHNGRHNFGDTFGHLRQLTVYHGTHYPIDELINNASLRNLTHLSLWPRSYANDRPEPNEEGTWAYISCGAAVRLIRSPNFPRLRHLVLRNTDLGDEGARALVESGLLGRLETLDLLGGCVTDAGARLLAESPDIRRLMKLDLSHNMLTEAGVAALQAAGVSLVAERQHGPEALEWGEYLHEGDCE